MSIAQPAFAAGSGSRKSRVKGTILTDRNVVIAIGDDYGIVRSSLYPVDSNPTIVVSDSGEIVISEGDYVP